MAEKKLRLAHAKEGHRLDGKVMRAAEVTHDQAQALSNRGHAKWFIWVDASQHPVESERPSAKPQTHQQLGPPPTTKVKESPATTDNPKGDDK